MNQGISGKLRGEYKVDLVGEALPASWLALYAILVIDELDTWSVQFRVISRAVPKSESETSDHCSLSSAIRRYDSLVIAGTGIKATPDMQSGSKGE